MVDLAGQMPSMLKKQARWERIGNNAIPALIAHPDWDSVEPVPFVIWMHGRTVSKELDPGRYLRWIRAGFGVCAVDLPGHGERFLQFAPHVARGRHRGQGANRAECGHSLPERRNARIPGATRPQRGRGRRSMVS